MKNEELYEGVYGSGDGEDIRAERWLGFGAVRIRWPTVVGNRVVCAHVDSIKLPAVSSQLGKSSITVLGQCSR